MLSADLLEKPCHFIYTLESMGIDKEAFSAPSIKFEDIELVGIYEKMPKLFTPASACREAFYKY